MKNPISLLLLFLALFLLAQVNCEYRGIEEPNDDSDPTNDPTILLELDIREVMIDVVKTDNNKIKILTESTLPYKVDVLLTMGTDVVHEISIGNDENSNKYISYVLAKGIYYIHVTVVNYVDPDTSVSHKIIV